MIFAYTCSYSPYGESDGDWETDRGFLWADSFETAMSELSAYYGEDYIEKVTLQPFAPDNLLIFVNERGALYTRVKGELSEDIVW